MEIFHYNFISYLDPTNISFWGYFLAFLASFLETVLALGLLLPGSTIVLFLGAIANYGWLNFEGVLVAAIIGAILGDNINYTLGKKYAYQWFEKGFWFLKAEYFISGKKYFRQHGGKSIFLARFIPTFKEVVPFIAGAFKMNYREFLFWNFLGSIGWSLEWVGMGYLFAHSLNLVKVWLSRTGFFLFWIILIGLLIFWWYQLTIQRKKQEKYWDYPLWRFAFKKILENKWIRKEEKKYPFFFRIARYRFRENYLSGLPLTWLLIILLITFLVGLWGKETVYLSQLPFIDHLTIYLLRPIQIFTIAKYVWIISFLGKSWLVLILALIISVIWWMDKKNKIYLIPFWINLIGAELTTHWMKNFIARPRPIGMFYPETTFSFPSGHATLVVAFYGFLTYFLIRETKNWNKQIKYFWLAIIIIVTIGFSRLYLGVHYLSDVLAGYIIGLMWLMMGVIILNWIKKNKF